jgi:RNA polymerase sigma factor (sigma-70 family)
MSDENWKYGTDEDLMLAYQEGHSEAFNLLYDRIADRLYGYLRRRLHSEELVDDIFQATMTKFHQTRFQYRPPLPVLPWAFTICRTVMIDAIRERNRRKEDAGDMQTFEAPATPIENNATAPTLPDSLLGLRTLTDTQKEAVALRFESDLSFEEIASRLQTSPANARQLVSRALKKLKSFASKKGER